MAGAADVVGLWGLASRKLLIVRMMETIEIVLLRGFLLVYVSCVCLFICVCAYCTSYQL